jgi:DNA-binding CsgD family transcriptional regulator
MKATAKGLMTEMLQLPKDGPNPSRQAGSADLPFIKAALTGQPGAVDLFLETYHDENSSLPWAPVASRDSKIETYSLALEASVEERGRDMKNAWRELERQSEIRGRTKEALQIILDGIEVQKKELEEEITHNLNRTIRPTLDQLRSENISEKASFLLESLELNLTHVFSSFGLNISQGHHSLTPRELQVCQMIRSGLQSREIAKIMGVSCQTVLVHRKNVRKKLRLTKSNMNLASFLRSHQSSDELL